MPISGLLDIGRYPDGVDGTATEIADALRSARFESVARPDIMRWKYTKLLMNLGNAVDATCAPSEAAANSSCVTRVARALRPSTQPASNTRRRTKTASAEATCSRIRPIEGSGRGGGSTWQSLARGTGAIEADYLNGEIVRIGREHGVATPVNERVRTFANEMARRRAEPRSADAMTLVRDLGLDPS